MDQDYDRPHEPADNMISQRFGWLIVRGPSKRRTRHGDAYWRCQCRCGRTAYVIGTDLRSGNTQSCGCLHVYMPWAKRLLAEYQAGLSEETTREWWARRNTDSRFALALSLMHALLHRLTIQTMDWPGVYTCGPVPSGTAEVPGRGIETRAGRQPRYSDIVYEGDDIDE